MDGISGKNINDKIKECRRLLNPGKVILCLEELLRATNDGMVAYSLGYEYEKIGNSKIAIKYYERAESLFTQISYKNMARSAINILQIETILAERKRAKSRHPK